MSIIDLKTFDILEGDIEKHMGRHFYNKFNNYYSEADEGLNGTLDRDPRDR